MIVKFYKCKYNQNYLNQEKQLFNYCQNMSLQSMKRVHIVLHQCVAEWLEQHRFGFVELLM